MIKHHYGRFIEDECRSVCSCGFHSQSNYPYQAKGKLLKHYEKMGTLRHTEGIFDRMDHVNRFLSMGIDGQERKRWWL